VNTLTTFEDIKVRAIKSFERKLYAEGARYKRDPFYLRKMFEYHASLWLPSAPSAYAQFFEEDNSLYDPRRLIYDGVEAVEEMSAIAIVQETAKLMLVEDLFRSYNNWFQGERWVFFTLCGEQFEIDKIYRADALPFTPPRL
jgi:hypothetical protein